MKRRTLYLVAAAVMAAMSFAPVAGAAAVGPIPFGPYRGPADHPDDLGILAINEGPAGLQSGFYFEKVVGFCGLGPAIMYDGAPAWDGSTLTLQGPFTCTDTGETPEGFDDFSLAFAYNEKTEEFTMLGAGDIAPLERQCVEPMPGNGIVQTGGPGDDVLVGTNGNDELNGKRGYDILCGFDGKDHLEGNGDTDVIFGGNGKDDLRGRRGYDFIDGGNGRDKLFGNAQNDYLHGGNQSDKIKGGGGSGDFADGGKNSPTGDTCKAENEINCENDF